MTKSEILDWYCNHQEYLGCEACRYNGHNRRSECLPAKQLSTMLDALIQSAPDKQMIEDNFLKQAYNTHCKEVTAWKQEASR